MNDLTTLSILEMRQGLVASEFSATELTHAHLDKIKETNPKYNSFLRVTEELALTQAKAADEKIAKDKNNTPLLTGIPVAIKDQLVINGIESTCASKILKGFIPPYTCTAVEKLIQAGAVILGKTNQDEFAMGSSGENSAFGITRNPINTDYVPGGSSSGSAVAVAAGQAPLSLGTDTGGSIRQPASFTGIVGIKPTYGRVSRNGAVAFASSLDQIGLFARNVKDIAIGLKYIAGHDPRDSTSMDIEVPDYLKNIDTAFPKIKNLRIGIPKEYFTSGINPEVEQVLRNKIQQLKSLGINLVEISLQHTEISIAAYYIIACAEAASNLARFDGVRYGWRSKSANNIQEVFEKSRAEGFGDEVKRRILLGNYVLSAGYYDAYYKKGLKARTLIIKDFQEAFKDCDIIVTPVAPTTAFKFGDKSMSPLEMYLSDAFTVPCSLAGLPGISIPCGKDSKGLPIGMQLIGKAFSEVLLLSTAHHFYKN
ncbi:MAG: Asp-tRNA(Asn)/Glu-tRNA(Gln) amidotransferase subunit GatA [Deltaproteobacteria bacterium]|jgi:aspartyl-tRNA(Asn)/glutamyl-tRNA(Gln) amidotransferase subunit A|nr:Asp-tRNA(Asn)/Glu-tRNA(Gln) amidotransferase subunit GatA [Deltaproteobacteria bacterium]